MRTVARSQPTARCRNRDMERTAEVVAPKVPIPELRDLTRAQVDAIGIRPAARVSGIGSSSLVKLLDGSHPHEKTRRKLEIWYWTVQAEAGTESDGHGEAAALHYLLRGLRAGQRAQAAAAVLIMIESMYDEDEQRIPWPRGFTLALTPVRKGVVG